MQSVHNLRRWFLGASRKVVERILNQIIRVCRSYEGDITLNDMATLHAAQTPTGTTKIGAFLNSAHIPS